MKILSGHISPETAFVVADYPYGFRLRCQIRYWLDYKAGKGVRFVSQTSNPKVAGIVWNKPKASTYCRFGGAMYLDADGHVQWSGMTEYSDAAKCAEWLNVFGAGNHPDCAETSRLWALQKAVYEAARAEGADMATAAAKARAAAVIDASTLTVEKAKDGLWIRNKERSELGRALLLKGIGFWTVKTAIEELPITESEFAQWYVCNQD